MTRPALEELDDRLIDIGCGLHALQFLSSAGRYSADIREEPDTLWSAIDWVTARLIEQVNSAGNYAEEQSREPPKVRR
ncbi:hypothetical protein [Muricoccus radiodurans]|uniref:hypothetical protein n=1 Tax=Muricoccus radiodurans TaxID=2231721 RepID=UPI003CEC331D